MKKIAIFCSGNGSNFQAIADAVRRGKLRAEIALMVTDNPSAFAIHRAKKSDIPVCALSPKLFSSRADFEKLIVRVLRSQKVDCVVLAGFMRILTPYFISAYHGRILNIHPSLLPAFKGAHAIRDAHAAGVKVTGVTVHEVTEKLDSGPIWAQEKVNILKSDTLRSLEIKIHHKEYRLYPKTIGRFIRFCDAKRRD